MVRLNDRLDVRRIYDGLHFEKIETSCTVGSADQKAPVVELIISAGPKPGDGTVEKQPGLI